MSSYSDSRFGPKRRVIIGGMDDFGATGISTGGFVSEVKTKITKFGIIPVQLALESTSSGSLVLELASGTDLGTFTIATRTSYPLGTATGVTITATIVAPNKLVVGNVTEAGSKGSFVWFIDVQEVFDAGVDHFADPAV